MAESVQYNEDNIRSLDWYEHIRLRPGMYIGKLGDGTTADDGIYVLLKEILDNVDSKYLDPVTVNMINFVSSLSYEMVIFYFV